MSIFFSFLVFKDGLFKCFAYFSIGILVYFIYFSANVNFLKMAGANKERKCLVTKRTCGRDFRDPCG